MAAPAILDMAKAPAAGLSVGVLRRWSGKVLLSVTDQGLSSGAHFALNVLLARWLTPSDYGVFVLVYAVFLLAAGLQHALILEPMCVIGPGLYESSLPLYFGMTLWMHGGLAVALAAAFAATAAVMKVAGFSVPAALIAMCLAGPCILLFWLFRRACYLKTRPDLAAKASLGYAFILAAGLLGLRLSGAVSATSAFFLMGAGGVAVSLAGWRCLGVHRGELFSRQTRAGLAKAASRHWAYARWALGTMVLYWLANSIYLPLLGVRAGLPAVAAFRATDNLLLPMGQILTAVGLLLLPWETARARVEGPRTLSRIAWKTSLLTGAAATVYALAVMAAGPVLIRLAYGGSFYVSYLSMVPYLGAALVIRAVGDTGIGIATRASGRPDIGFWSTVAAAAVTLTAGLGLVARHGATGAAAGWMLSSAASCAVSLWLFRRLMK